MGAGCHGLLAAVAVGAAIAVPAPAAALGNAERIDFESFTVAGAAQLLRHDYAPDAKVLVGGRLLLPEASSGRVPLVIVAGGEGGESDGEGRWPARLGSLGIASFVIDSLAPRGLQSVGLYLDVLSIAAEVTDAFLALQRLARDPRIDPRRIAIMGASRGGRVALATALEPLRRSVIAGDARFAGHIALYAGCDIRFTAAAIDRAPLLLLHGAADDYAPIGHCRDYAAWFAARGAAVRFVALPGAPHGFDRPGQVTFDATAATAAGCDLERDLDTMFARRIDTGELVIGRPALSRYYESCTGRGAHAGGDAAALAAAERQLEAFLRDIFKL